MKFNIIATALLFVGFSFGAYSGTPKTPSKIDGCYQIGSAEELYGFAELINDTTNGLAKSSETCAKLTADIIVNENVLKNDTLDDNRTDFIAWTPINKFSGSFDGQEHFISGLYYDDTELYFDNDIPVGFFREILSASTPETTSTKPSIKKLGIVDSYFNARGIVGAIAGEATNLEMSKCYNKSIVIGGYYTGGLVGYGVGVSIMESYNEAFIYAKDSYYALHKSQLYAGGIIGMIYTKDNYIKNVYNAGPIKGYKAAGGLVGQVAMEGTRLFLSSSFNVGTINGYYGNLIANQIKTTYVETSSTFNISNKATDTDSLRTAEDFASGLIALVLRNSPGGDVWGQNIGTDTHPTLSGQLSGYSGNAKISKITFNSYNGDTTKYPSNYVEGFGLKLPVATQNGYVFAGWYKNKNAEGKSIKNISALDTGDITLFANWWAKPSYKNGCYEISSEGDLYAFAAIVNGTDGMEKELAACGKLTQDIVLNQHETRQWTPINYFQGTFDGQGHVISGLYLNDEDLNYAGFFGKDIKGSKEKPVIIQNLGLENCTINACWYIGAFVGSQMGHLTLKNVYNRCTMKTSNYGGGLVGYVYGNTTIVNSYSAANTYNAAGLVGGVNAGASPVVTIINSFNYGSYRTGIFANSDLVARRDTTSTVKIINSFNLNGKSSDLTGSAQDSTHFADGTVAKALHEYNENGVDGSVWGQNVGVDSYPVHSGKITYTITSSSSSADTESSSSVISSSSKEIIESSSSSGKANIATLSTKALQARIYQHSHSILVENFVGNVSVFDLNGNLIRSVYSNGQATIRLERTGSYIVKTGAYSRRISLTTNH